MTQRPPHDPAVEDPAAADPAVEGHSGADAGSAGDAAETPTAAPRPGPGAAGNAEPSKAAAPVSTRPGPRPSPTSRARRAAAAPEGLRRPSPRPAQAAAATTAPAVAGPAATTPAAEPGPERAADHAAGSLDAQPAELVSRQPSAAERDRRAPAWLVAVLTVLVLALGGLDGWLLTSQPTSGSRAERDQALSTAKSAVPLILSYNHQRFDSDVAAAKARLTGRAVTDYVQAMTKTIKPTATKVQAVVQAQTNGAGVEAVSGDGDHVTVVVFGEQKVTNTSLKTPRTDLFRVRVTLDRVQGQWLVSKFDQI